MTAALAEIGQAQQSLKAQAIQPKDKTALDTDVKKKEEAFKTALTELRKQVDEVTKKYSELGADETVKKAIDEMKKAGRVKENLGPSDNFLAGVKELDQAERQFLGKRTPAESKKKTAAEAKNEQSGSLLRLPGQEVPDVGERLGGVIRILDVAGDAPLPGNLLEPQPPSRGVNEIVHLADAVRLGQPPFVLEVDRRIILAEQVFRRPLLDQG